MGGCDSDGHTVCQRLSVSVSPSRTLPLPVFEIREDAPPAGCDVCRCQVSLCPAYPVPGGLSSALRTAFRSLGATPPCDCNLLPVPISIPFVRWVVAQYVHWQRVHACRLLRLRDHRSTGVSSDNLKGIYKYLYLRRGPGESAGQCDRVRLSVREPQTRRAHAYGMGVNIDPPPEAVSTRRSLLIQYLHGVVRYCMSTGVYFTASISIVPPEADASANTNTPPTYSLRPGDTEGTRRNSDTCQCPQSTVSTVPT